MTTADGSTMRLMHCINREQGGRVLAGCLYKAREPANRLLICHSTHTPSLAPDTHKQQMWSVSWPETGCDTGVP